MIVIYCMIVILYTKFFLRNKNKIIIYYLHFVYFYLFLYYNILYPRIVQLEERLTVVVTYINRSGVRITLRGFLFLINFIKSK